MTVARVVVVEWKWPEEKARRAGRDILDAVDRGFEVKDVLKSILNVVGGGCECYARGQLSLLKTTKRGEWLC